MIKNYQTDANNIEIFKKMCYDMLWKKKKQEVKTNAHYKRHQVYRR